MYQYLLILFIFSINIVCAGVLGPDENTTIRYESTTIQINNQSSESAAQRLTEIFGDLQILFDEYREIMIQRNELSTLTGCTPGGFNLEFFNNIGHLCSIKRIMGYNIRLEGRIYGQSLQPRNCIKEYNLYLNVNNDHSRPRFIMNNVNYGKVHFCLKMQNRNLVLASTPSVRAGQTTNVFFNRLENKLKPKLEDFIEAMNNVLSR